jgi:hypothetical protein
MVTKKNIFLRTAASLGQKVQSYCIVTGDASGKQLVAGMILLVEPYPFLMDHRKNAPFLWFLAAAPSEFLRQRLNNARPSMLQALVDVGIVFSLQRKYQGRIGLHADPKGGDALAARYLHCGLQALPDDVTLPMSRELMRRFTFNREGPGPYFYADTNHAEDILVRSDHLRTYPPGAERPKKEP